MKPTVIVQCSRMSWSGGVDLSVRPLADNRPVVWHTIRRIAEVFPHADIRVIAPACDSPYLDWLGDAGSGGRVFYGNDGAPLLRIIGACRDLSAEDVVFRVNGLNFCASWEAAEGMTQFLAQNPQIDCAKFHDDWPAQTCFEAYRMGALRQAARKIRTWIYPWVFMATEHSDWGISYSETELLNWRWMAAPVYAEGRERVSIGQGLDNLEMHYRWAAMALWNGAGRVLDAGSGDGYGSRHLMRSGQSMTALDFDFKCLPRNDIRSVVGDIRDLPFASGSFDAATCFETIEHVSEGRAVACELHRVIQPGGKLFLSTPQNRFGHIPINAAHIIEYSLEAIKDLLAEFFSIRRVVGFKGGSVWIEGDPVGNNTYLECVKES